MTSHLSSLPRIYLDNNSTTPVAREVFDAMEPYFQYSYGNPSSAEHQYGAGAFTAVKLARQQVADLLGARPREIVFTSGATESNNLAIKGFASAAHPIVGHIITVSTEHKSVLEPCAWLESRGWSVTYLQTGENGLVDVGQIAGAIRDDTMLVSVMAANNETGVMPDLASVGRLVRDHDIVFHTDATQALAYTRLSVDDANIDLLSMSGHKMYGPKGVGALYVRKRGKRLALEPLIHGGGQEYGMRAGTLNVPGIVGLGMAAELSDRERSSRHSRLCELSAVLLELITDGIDGAMLNGSRECRLPNNLNVWLPRVDAKALCAQVQDVVAVSTGSACSSGENRPSHVLLAMGLTAERARESVRIGLGRSTSAADVHEAAQAVLSAAQRLRALNAPA